MDCAQKVGTSRSGTVAIDVARLSWSRGAVAQGTRRLPEEVGVSLVFDGTACGVMMATPDDLEDFALGFALNEGIVRDARDIAEMEVVDHPAGLEVRTWLKPNDARRLRERRRFLVGPTGCGLCGLESLDDANRLPPPVDACLTLDAASVRAAMDALTDSQHHGQSLRALHAAAFWNEKHGLVAAREDVGRHNALDKLAGALARQNVRAADGLVAITSRVSIEMIQKTAMMGAPILLAISAPTALAVRVAQACKVTLVGIARNDGFEVFSHPHRVRVGEPFDAAFAAILD